MDAFVLVGMDLNLNSFNRFSKGRQQFYYSLFGPDDRAEPKNFDVRKQFDVARLGELLGVNIVIYYADDSCSKKNKRAKGRRVPEEEEEGYLGLDVFHNYTDFIPPPSSQSADVASDRKILPIVYFVITSSRRIYYVRDAESLKIQVEWAAAQKTTQKQTKAVSLNEVGLGEALCRLLEVDDCFSENPALEKVRTGNQLVWMDPAASSSLAKLERPLVIAIYTRRGGLAYRYGGVQKKAVFEIVYKSDALSYVADQKNRDEDRRDSQHFKLPSSEDVDVLVTVGGSSVITQANKPVHDRVYSLLNLLPAEDKFDSSYIFSGLSPGADFEDRLREARRKKLEKKMKEGKWRGCQKWKLCDCDVCQESAKEYEFNMDDDGPEKLLTVDFGCRELLRLLGLDSRENLDLVDRLVDLSIAAFDIESKTVEVDAVRPDPNLYSEIDPQMSVEGHYKKIQRPIMIAHMDGLDEEGDPQTWTVQGDDEFQVYKMMEDYFRNVLQRKKRADAEKCRLAEGLRKKLWDWRNLFVDFFRSTFRGAPRQKRTKSLATAQRMPSRPTEIR